VKPRLLEVLICPTCGGSFRATASEGDAGHVVTGRLECGRGHVFPVVNGIPRLLALDDADFARRFAHTRDSFSSEWAMMRDDDRAWGLDVPARQAMFTAALGIEMADLRGRTLLDAGCGHGEVEMALAGTGVEIFAVDMSSSVDAVQRRLARTPGGDSVHLVQGNIHALPFAEKAFDIVHSAGVLHHTPDTREGFRIVSQRVKPGGRCYIEVYSAEKKNPVAHAMVTAARAVTVRLPHSVLHAACFAGAPLLWAFSRGYNAATGTGVYRVRTLRECELSLFDGFSPRFAHHHATDEVMGWFDALGFTGLRKTFEHKNGFGVMGVKPVVEAP
jgi:2-polyprenyl-3-methyl-5-hydroxy-6-metoxy-1,4-benzoquinol methylase/uncharacterized protein YbaR (Trm112 family)